MISALKKIRKDSLDSSSFLNNFLSLVLIQGLNYLLAFFITPYVVRKLGPENFGLVSFSQSYVTYFTLIINFGFDLSATREVAKNLENSTQLNKIFSEVLLAKTILFLISLLVFSFTIFFSNQLQNYSKLNIIGFLINIGFVLYPQWLFQGLSKMKVALIITSISRFLMLLFIIYLIRGKDDYLAYNLINSLFNIFIGVVAAVYLIHSKTVRLCSVSLKNVFSRLYFSFTIFLSLAVYSLYTSSNIVFLGFLSSKASTGYFSCAAKLITLSLSVLFIPFATVVFPRISQKLNASSEIGILFLKKIVWITFLFGTIMSLVIYFFSDSLIFIFYGKEFYPAVRCLKALSLLPFITSLSNVFAVQGLLNLKMDKHFLVTMLIVAICSITLNLILIPKLNEIGACISWNIAEIAYLVLSGIFLHRRIGFPFDLSVLKPLYAIKQFRYDR